MENRVEKKKDAFGNALYDVEHALGMYALSYCTIPAEYIYDKAALAPMMDVLSKCHIYIIGFTPIISFLEAVQKGEKLDLTYEIAGKAHVLSFDIPGLNLVSTDDAPYLENNDGEKFWMPDDIIQTRLNHETKAVTFMVK